MKTLNAALAEFLGGQIEFAQLDQALIRVLAADPTSGPAAFAAIDQVYRSGRLPLQLYVQLKNRIAQSHAAGLQRAAAPAAPPGENPAAPPAPGRRSTSPVEPAAPPRDDVEPPAADRTIMRAPPSGLETPPPPSSDPFSGLSEPASTTGTGPAQTGTGGHTSSARTGGTGSTWSDPAKWADQSAASMGPGSVLKGRFVLENVVGRGGMGVVFRARDLRKEEAQDRDPFVAIKILNDEFRRHPESLKALQRESRKAQNLAHPNIATVFDFDRDGGTVYMQMEFLEGDSLDKLIKKPSFEGLPFSDAYPFIEGLGRALAYAHGKGIVHSDFKPGNCFLTTSGVIKVFDFGIARAAKLPGKQQGDVTRFDPGTLGALTPAYASCEMIEGLEPDPRDDVYALGCVAYELLTGRHPFNKQSAVDARDAKLVPAPIKNLRRSRFRALQKALAFRREQRSATVDDFLGELGGSRFDLVLIGGASAAAVVALLGVVFVPGMLEERRIGSLVAVLTSGDDTQVAAGIEQYEGLDPLTRATVLPQVRDALLDYYSEAIGRAADNFDYPEAERIVAQANLLIQDSLRLGELETELANRKSALLQELDTRFNANLAANRVLSDPDNDDIPEVLARLARVEPGHLLLADPRLPLKYAELAASAFEGQDFGRTSALIGEGLGRFPGSVSLINVQDQLNAALEAEAVQQRVAELRNAIGTMTVLESVDELVTLENDFLELAGIAPTDPLVAQYRARLGTAVQGELDGLLAARDWPTAERRLNEVARVLSEADLAASRQQIARAQGGFEQERETLVATLNAAASAGRLDDALAGLEALTSLGVDAATLQRGRQSIVQGHLIAARAARARGNLAEAEAIVAAGLGFEPAAGVLVQEQSAIVQAANLAEAQDREAAAQALQAQVQALADTISAGLAQATFGIDEAEQTLTSLNELSALAPGDPLATSGRDQVAGKLADRARTLGADSDFEAALALLDQAINLVSESDTLRGARDELARGQDQYLVSQRQGQIESELQALAGLLEAPSFEADWEGRTRELLDSLGRMLPGDDPTVPQARVRVGGLYVGRAAEMREQERFSEADRLLGIATGFAPELEAVALERTTLDDAQRRFASENAEQIRLAELQGLRQTFLAAAQANDISRARATLESLRGQLPAGDEFLVTTAPQEVAGILLRLARGAFAEARFDRAEQLVAEGLEVAPGLSALEDLLGNVRSGRLDSNVAELGTILDTAVPEDAARPRILLASIASDAGDEYPEFERALLAKAEQRIAGGGEGLSEWLGTIFERDFAAPAPAPAGSDRPCMASLAGYGSARGGRGLCYDMLADDVRGPTLVVVPAGGAFSAPFAIGRFEIAVRDWNDYCRLSGACSVRSGDDDTLPVTNVSLEEARGYAGWLSAQTGATYRLPTLEEWTYAAAAPREGNNDDNCVVAAAGRGGIPRSVNSGSQNSWGLVNFTGNAQELVTVGAGVEARGGNHQDALAQCTIELGKAHGGQADPVTGVRLLREMDGSG